MLAKGDPGRNGRRRRLLLCWRNILNFCAGLARDMVHYLFHSYINSLRRRPNRRHFADDILKCISWKKLHWFRLKVHRSLFPMVQITSHQHWFSQCWLFYWRIYASYGLNELTACGLMTPYSLRLLDHHCFRQWPVACSAPSYHLNKCCLSLIRHFRTNFGESWKITDFKFQFLKRHFMQVPERCKNVFELFNMRAVKFSKMSWIRIFQYMGKIRYFVQIVRGTLWNSTQNMVPIYRKMCSSLRSENF